MAAREGSFQAAERLLERFSNAEITDHMDRLPRDIAQDRSHHDIMRLLDQHAARSPQMSHMAANSPHMIPPPTVIGGSTKSTKKKRPKMPNTNVKEPISPGTETGAKRKASVRKRKDAPLPPAPISVVESSMSPANSLESPHPGSFDGNLSPTDPNMYGAHPMALSHPNMPNMDNVHMNQKQPPAYKECINGVTFSSGEMNYSDGLDAQGVYMMLPQQQQQQSHHHHPVMHPHQTIPASLPNNSLSHNMPHPPATTVMSPGKQRPSLPTSPTHMAAMRAAQHQKNAQMSPLNPQGANHSLQNQFEYPQTDLNHIYSTLDNNVLPQQTQPQQYQNYQYHQYPTPPSQHSHMGGPGETTPQHYISPETYLTPSPDSPGQWSSSSPHSASDWSEGISSPPAPPTSLSQQTMSHLDQMQAVHSQPQQHDAIYI